MLTSMMQSVQAFIATNRFGLGPRPGELTSVDRDPHAWLKRQIAPRPQMPAELLGLPPSADTIKRIHEARIEGPQTLKRLTDEVLRDLLVREVAAHAQAQLRTRAFAERMAAFWSNHFTVSGARFPIGPTAAAYEREAIRPHVFGRFHDMLLAVARHPVMLSYLDNALSIGPGSLIGRRSGRGLNENLAREILELHTLGVGGGYTQDDVIALAKILTGWSHGGIRDKRSVRRLGAVHGGFEFREAAHEPGRKRLLGRSYRENGEREAADALSDLARHPSTARFIATKLARHFIADDPPAEAISRPATTFLETDGDLAAVSRALITIDAVWATPLPKVKRPHELVISALRATAIDSLPACAFIGTFHELGQVPWHAPSPQGWPDTASDWISPEALMRRIEWVRAMAARVPRSRSVATFVGETIGPVISPATQEAIDAAPSGEEALTLVLASPEFQRR